MNTLHTDVAIVGGGPAGLMLAIELGCRGVRCVLLEEDEHSPTFPKANATSARTMEHYRRRGFADEIRALGLPLEHRQDVVYCTRLAATELARFTIPSRAQASRRESFGDYGEHAWPTPELPHRVQQMYIEPILKAQAQRYASVDIRFGQRATAIHDHGDHVAVEVAPATGEPWQLHAKYAVGCDGPRSLVRKSLGIAYSGQSKEDRDFFGGQMLSIYFRSSDLYQVLDKPQAWQYWAVNPAHRGLMVAIDGVETFLLIVQMAPGQTPADIDPRAACLDVIGAPHDFRLIDCMPWSAGYALVADRFSVGRLFLAGDAAHLFTPTGGMGYNTSIDDAVNLGWKLAATLQGWAGDELLATYEAERRPIALRNTDFARRMADSIGNLPVPAHLEDTGDDSAQARAALGCALAVHVAAEFNIPGLQLGVRYADSPVVATETTTPPVDEPNHYIPSGYPGARAPHVMVDGTPLFDLLGPDYTLLAFTDDDLDGWNAAAASHGMPLRTLRLEHAQARALYGADAVLIRPDHHIAWRGDAHADAAEILRMASGHRAGTSMPTQVASSRQTGTQSHTQATAPLQAGAQLQTQTASASQPEAQSSHWTDMLAQPPASANTDRESAPEVASRRPGVLAVHSVHRFVYTVPDLDEAERFYEAFGLATRREGKRLDLYTYGHPHCWGSIYENGAPKKMQYLSYGIFDDDLPAFTQRVRDSGLACEPHPLSDGTGLWLSDPDGLPLQLLVADKVSPSVPAVPVPTVRDAEGRGAHGRTHGPVVRPRRLSHVLRFSPDVPGMARFCHDMLGLRISDTAGQVIAFIHTPHGSDHHLVAFANAPTPGLHHTSWDVGSMNDVGWGAERMKAQGYDRGWGVGRHYLGSNYFYYVRDPWGSYAEYSFDIDYVAANVDWPAAEHGLADSLHVWGPDVPEDFITNFEPVAAAPASATHR